MEKNKDFWRLSFNSKNKTAEVLKFIAAGSFFLSTAAIILGGFSQLFNVEQTQILPFVSKVVEVFAPVFVVSGFAANASEPKKKKKIK